MTITTDLQGKLALAASTMAAAVLTIQQLRQAKDAADEALALAQAVPTVPVGSVLLSAAEQAALAAMGASASDSVQALADAIGANALMQVVPVAPPPVVP